MGGHSHFLLAGASVSGSRARRVFATPRKLNPCLHEIRHLLPGHSAWAGDELPFVVSRTANQLLCLRYGPTTCSAGFFSRKSCRARIRSPPNGSSDEWFLRALGIAEIKAELLNKQTVCLERIAV